VQLLQLPVEDQCLQLAQTAERAVADLLDVIVVKVPTLMEHHRTHQEERGGIVVGRVRKVRGGQKGTNTGWGAVVGGFLAVLVNTDAPLKAKACG
jgi:hypothetical protein